MYNKCYETLHVLNYINPNFYIEILLMKNQTSNNVPLGLALFKSVSVDGIAFRLFIPFRSNCFSMMRALFAYESATSL